jgi:hypothetical protein
LQQVEEQLNELEFITHVVLNVSLQDFSTASGAAAGYTSLNFEL